MKEVEYIELKKSKKFTPALYYERNGVWEGGSTSQFSPVMIFKLWEKFSDTCLEVFESMEVNGKRHLDMTFRLSIRGYKVFV